MAEDQTDREIFLKNYPQASRGGLEKLDNYSKMLVEWQGRFNLIAPSTIPLIWSRHFLDSAQLVPLLPERRSVIADLGSGAGFPGLVLAILTDHEVHLVESTGKKATFLRSVAAELGLNVTIHQARIESLRDFRADVITARALVALPDLLTYANALMKKDSFCLFLKGQKLEVELTEAAKSWTFETEKSPSLSDPTGTILMVRSLRKREKPRVPPARKQSAPSPGLSGSGGRQSKGRRR